MSERQPALGLLLSAAGGVEQVRTGLVEPAMEAGWTVAITATPTAATWLEDVGELDKLGQLTGYEVRVYPRMPREASPHPAIDVYGLIPASSNTVAKLALGIADNQLLTAACEALGGQQVPIVVFPRVNAAHARQPMWDSHIDALRKAGAYLAYGNHVWPLHEPRSSAGKALPWDTLLGLVNQAYSDRPDPA